MSAANCGCISCCIKGLGQNGTFYFGRGLKTRSIEKLDGFIILAKIFLDYAIFVC
jgi:hypothetical protein